MLNDVDYIGRRFESYRYYRMTSQQLLMHLASITKDCDAPASESVVRLSRLHPT